MLRPMTYLVIIFLAVLLKRFGMFGPRDYRILSKIFVNVTLPLTIIHAFAGFSPRSSLYVLIPIGFGLSILPGLLMFFVTRRRKTEPRSFFMLNAAGYNIGGFGMPVIQLLFGVTGATCACMFDLGNALVACGGEYALTAAILGIGSEKEGFAFKAKTFCKSIFSSAAVDVYLLMLVLMLLHVRIPEVVGSFTEPFSAANGFLSMFMLGLMFHIEHNPEKLHDVIKILVFRVAFGICLGMIIYHLLPFDDLTRKVIAICVCAPPASITPVYTEQIGADGATASFLNSLNVIASFIIIFIYMFLLF